MNLCWLLIVQVNLFPIHHPLMLIWIMAFLNSKVTTTCSSLYVRSCFCTQPLSQYLHQLQAELSSQLSVVCAQ